MMHQTSETAFPAGMKGLYKSDDGIIVITGTTRAFTFADAGHVFYQFRDLYTAPDGKIAGAVRATDHLILMPQQAPNPTRIRSDYGRYPDGRPTDSSPEGVTYKPLGNQDPDAIVRISLGPNTSRGYPKNFSYQAYNAQSRGLFTGGNAYRVGTTQDIKISGTYKLGKTITMEFHPDSDEENPQPFKGTMIWSDHTYDLTGFRDYTHLYWEARLRETGELLAKGFAEWDPTSSALGEEDGTWKPTDQIYLMAEGQAFGNPRTMTLQRTGD